METKKKKQLYNGLMIAGILLFMIIGVAGIGISKGWFHKSNDEVITAEKNGETEKSLETTEPVNSETEKNIETENPANSETEENVATENPTSAEVTENADSKLKTESPKENTEIVNKEETVTSVPVEPTPVSHTMIPPVATPVPVPAKSSCHITIQCTTILEHMDKLDEAKHAFVPKDGYILKDYEVEVKQGDKVFDVLKRACDEKKIPLEYAFTPIYNSYYIEGINHLYEFDCGNLSGWMYTINDGLPQYGSSSCDVKEKDQIVWLYTCEGLGADVGRSVN